MGVAAGVASVPVAATVLYDDVVGPGTPEAVGAFLLVAQPAASTHEAVFVADFLHDLPADGGLLVGHVVKIPLVAVGEGESLVLERVAAVAVVVRVALPALDGDG